MNSELASEDQNRCVSCRKLRIAPPVEYIGQFLYLLQTPQLCKECRKEVLLPPEERFEELFKGARTLFKEGITEEDKIIPTLAFANDVSQDISTCWVASERRTALITGGATRPDKTEETEEEKSVIAKQLMRALRQQARECKLMKAKLVREKELLAKADGDVEAWESKVEEFIQEHGDLRPIGFVNDVLILEQLPISIKLKTFPETEVPRGVQIEVHVHPRPVKPEHVKLLYEKVLSDAGITRDETEMRHASMSFLHMNPFSLSISIGPGMWPADETCEPYCPHPWLVQEYYRMLLGAPSKGGFARDLIGRQRGSSPKADNLIPACVAFYLKLYLPTYGEKLDRTRIHRLLNKHILCELRKTLPEEGYSSSEVNQLWRDVEKVATPLLHTSSRLINER
jgi:hypothetical protein